jgi:hypothetical protein
MRTGRGCRPLPGDDGRHPTAWSILRERRSYCPRSNDGRSGARLVGDLWKAGKAFLAGFRRHLLYLLPNIFVAPFEFYERVIRPNFLSETWPEHWIVPAFAFPWVLLGTVIWTAFLTFRDLYKEKVQLETPKGLRSRAGAVDQPDQRSPSSDTSGTTAPAQSATAQILVPQDAYYLPDPAAKGYPHKLKIVLQIESAQDIIVTPAQWQNTWDFTLPPLNEHPWQPEGPRGWRNCDWGRETHEPLLVRSGRAIQTWVGLPGPVDKIELRRRIVTKRLGTLIVPFTIDGGATSERVRL